MFKHFITLEWKAFFRSPALATNIVLKIFIALGVLYFAIGFMAVGALTYFLIKDEMGQDPMVIVNKFIIYYFIADLLIRLLLQKIPVINIRPLLTLPIKRSSIVNFALGKTVLSVFNILHAFFFIPFTLVLLRNDYGTGPVLLWHLSIIALIYINNFLALMLNSRDGLFIVFLGIVAALGAMQYYGIFDITEITSLFYFGLYSTSYMFIVPLAVLGILYWLSYKYFYNHLYLDTGLKGKHEVAKTEQYTWLNKYGTMGTFLKNDIKLLKRNKRSRGTLIASFFFLFYGLLFFNGGIQNIQLPVMSMFAGIFVSGGFLFTFGQFVPSWDSAYYPLMMSQNIKYRDYIASKWWLIVIGTVICTILSSFYLFMGIDTYLIIIASAIFNIGVNSHLVLLGGAYTKTPIDLSSGKQAFGDKKAFNIKTMLLSIPKMLVPMALFGIGSYAISPMAGYILVAGAGILGFAFRNAVFSKIEKVYKTEKYDALASYKQKA